jgi:hypothetical protein
MVTRRTAMLGTILLIVLILALVGSLSPAFPYSVGRGYGPSGLIGTLLVVWLILVLVGRV